MRWTIEESKMGMNVKMKFQYRVRKLQPRCVCKNAGTREQGYDNNRLHCLAVREDDGGHEWMDE